MISRAMKQETYRPYPKRAAHLLHHGNSPKPLPIVDICVGSTVDIESR